MRQQVFKGLVNLFKTFSKPITEIKDAATEVSTDFTQDSNNEHHSGSEIEIIRSLSNLADVIVRLQGIIDEERSRSHSLLEENFELKSQQIAIENKTGKRSQAQQWHQSLSNAYPKNKRNKSTFKSRTKTPIIYEDIHSDESREISASRANIGIKLENKRKQGQDQSLKSIGNNQASQKAAKTTKTSETMTSAKENNNNSNNNTNVNNEIEAQKRTGKKENYSSKNKVKFNNISQCGRAEESQNTENTGGQQIEKPSQKIKITIVGDSQLKRLDETKLSNHHHQVKIIANGGSRFGQATQQVGKSDSDIIVVHAGTNDIKSSNPDMLSDDIINTLNKIQESNPSSQIAYSSMFRRNDKNDPTPNRKGAEVNKILEEKLNLHGFDLINNANILFCNLWKDGLHITDGGIRKFAGNLSSYFRYC